MVESTQITGQKKGNMLCVDNDCMTRASFNFKGER